MDLLIFTTLAFKKAKKKGVIIDMEDLGFPTLGLDKA